MHSEKRYLNDSYLMSFQATVLSCDPLAGGHYRVILDTTCFYPESGGQVSDTGMIADASVVHVTEEEDGLVVHEVTREVPEGEVTCRIDWDRRFDHMQQHSGQHILSRAFIQVCGAKTVGFHMGEETCTIDLNIEHLDEDIIYAVENVANGIIVENRPVSVSEVSPTDVSSMDMRKSIPAGTVSVRLVTIDDFDTCPCCGTHVKATGEIGMLKVVKYEKVKSLTRIYFKAGKRALRDYQVKHGIVSNLSNRFTTAPEKVEEKVEKLTTEHREARRALKKANERRLDADRAKLLGSTEEYHGYRFIVRRLDAADADYLRMLAAALASEEKIMVVLGGDAGCIVCNASLDVPVELSRCLTDAARRVGGSGGGKGSFASVRVPLAVDMAAFLEEVFHEVKHHI